MKAICTICERAFELVPVVIAVDACVHDDIAEQEFYLIPKHSPVAGKPTSTIKCSRTGKIREVICDGSHRPPSCFIH